MELLIEPGSHLFSKGKKVLSEIATWQPEFTPSPLGATNVIFKQEPKVEVHQ